MRHSLRVTSETSTEPQRWTSPLGNEQLAQLVRWTLDVHARAVDRAAIEKRLGAGSSAELAERCMRRAVRDAALLGASTGVGVSVIEILDLATAGASLAMTLPLVAADLVGITRIQLCAAYDLSLIHGAQLDPVDADDCHFALLAAIGGHPADALVDEGAALLPDPTTHRARRLVRDGMRKTLASGVHGAGRPWIFKRVTERVLLGLLPGVNIPVAAALNGYFTNRVVHAADALMVRRATIARQLSRVVAAGIEPHAVIGAVVCALHAPHRGAADPGWSDDELATLQMSVALARLDDVDAAMLDPYFEHDASFVARALGALTVEARTALRELLRVVAASGESESDAYAATIAVIAGDEASASTPSSPATLVTARGGTRSEARGSDPEPRST
jgi:hypothetical protein